MSFCCLEKEGETLGQGGPGVILKTGYGDDKCCTDKARGENRKQAVCFTPAEKMEDVPALKGILAAAYCAFLSHQN